MFESMVHFSPFSELKDGAPCTYCKACKEEGHPGKKIADHHAEPSSVFLSIQTQYTLVSMSCSCQFMFLPFSLSMIFVTGTQEGPNPLVPLVTALCRGVVKNPWEKHRGTTRVPRFLKDVIAPYWAEVHPTFPAFCCILQGYYTPRQLQGFHPSCDSWTIGAHIIPHSYEDFGPLKRVLELGWDSLDVPENGLPLCRVFEQAFDKLQLCFVYADCRWTVWVLDPSLRGRVEFTDASNDTKTRSACDARSGILSAPPSTSPRIFLRQRCLNTLSSRIF